MVCQHCQTEQPDPPPKFCDACGLATGAMPRKAVSAAAAKAKADAEIRCPECGLLAVSRRCSGCGAKVRWPDDVLPIDERPIPVSGPALTDAEGGGFPVTSDGGDGGDDGGDGDGGGGESGGAA